MAGNSRPPAHNGIHAPEVSNESIENRRCVEQFNEPEIQDSANGRERIRSRGSAEVDQEGVKQPVSPLKEFTRLENGSFLCKHCPSILRYRTSLRKHFSTHKPREYKCSVPECGKRFISKSNRDNHVKTVHEGRRDFKCPSEGCGKLFGEKSNMTAHLKSVHQGRKFKCPIKGCGQMLCTKYYLDSHVKDVHEGRRDFKCGMEGCGIAFGTKYKLQSHMSSKHNKMRMVTKKAELAQTINPQPDILPYLKVEVFEDAHSQEGSDAEHWFHLNS